MLPLSLSRLLQQAMGRHGRFENFWIGPSRSNRIGTADSNSNRISKLCRSLKMLHRIAEVEKWE